jgi:RNA polymerase sigma-70 factor (ECF subfamily)
VEKAIVSATLPPPSLPASALPGADSELLARFVRSGDEQAFAALVKRHGPMVLGVCRRVLGSHHDAEDAFQATFLILARNASSIRHPERLASWLYGVAHRTARKRREQRQRRQEAECQAGASPECRSSAASERLAATPPLELAWREVLQALDEEIARLEGKYRAPLVLCYLEGKGHEEAARTLGRPVGSMSWLLGRALAALRERLSRRGLTLHGGMPPLLLALQGPIPVPEGLAAATLRGLGAAGTASPLAALVEAVLRELAAERSSRLVRTLTGVLLGVALSAAGVTALSQRLAASSTRSGDTSAVQPCPGQCGSRSSD